MGLDSYFMRVIQHHQQKQSCIHHICLNLACSTKDPRFRCKCCGAWYCSRDCQIQDWNPRHKSICKPTIRERLKECLKYTNMPCQGYGEGTIFFKTPIDIKADN